MPRQYTRTPLADRFWPKVERRAPDECWPWLGARKRAPWDYGKISLTRGRPVSAHRVAWELAHGRAVPTGLGVLHTCDNPPCCNPSHLYVGTPADNIRDKIERGRQGQTGARGERNGRARLTEVSVREARRLLALGLTGTEIARRLGVSSSTIYTVRDGKFWKHVT